MTNYHKGPQRTIMAVRVRIGGYTHGR